MKVTREKSNGVPKGDFHAVGCVILHDNEILLLRRNPDKTDPLTWGLPGGKVEPKESPNQAARREVMEETSIVIDPSAMSHLSDYEVTHKSRSFTYSVFKYEVSGRRPTIVTSPREHLNHAWFNLDDALTVNLVPGTLECLLLAKTQLPIDNQLPLFELDEHPLLARIDESEILVRQSVHAEHRTDHPGRILVVIGPPGSGKSTLVRNLARFDETLSVIDRKFGQDKSTRQYLYLTKYLTGDPRFAFPCQIESLSNRYWQALDIGPSHAAVSDEWIYSSLAYSRALRMQKDLTEDEYQTFYSMYLALSRTLSPPTLTIHLTASSDRLRHRVLTRGRKLEQISHTIPYLERLRKSFHSVAREITAFHAPLVTIDTTELSPAGVAEIAKTYTSHHSNGQYG